MAAVSWEQQAATYFDTALKEPIRQTLIGRQLFAKQTVLGADKYRVNFNKIKELGKASAGRSIPSVGSAKDRLTLTSSEIDMIMIWKEYEIARADWDIFTAKGTNLEAVNVISAAQVVGVEEDAYLINGWKPDGTNFTEKGIYQIAGNAATGVDFGSYNNPTKSIMAGWAKLDEDNITGVNFNLLLNPVQYNEAVQSRSTNGVREWADLIDLLNPYGGAKGTIIKVPGNNVAAGTAVMSPVDTTGRYMDLVIGANYVNDVYLNGPSQQFSPMGGICVSSLIARFTYPEAIVTLASV